MRQLFKYGFTDALITMLTVVFWMYTSFLFNMEEYSNVYLVTYGFQFVFSVIYAILTRGTLKHEIMVNKRNHFINTSLYLQTLLYVVIFGISVFNLHSILDYYSLDYISYRYPYIYCLIYMILDFIIASIKTVYQYQKNDKKAFKITVLYYLIRFSSVTILKIIGVTSELAVAVSVILCFLLTLVFILKDFTHLEKGFSLIQSIKYSLTTLPVYLLCCIIYLFGITDMTEASELVLYTSSIFILCTDTLWDCANSAVSTRVSLDVDSGKFDIKKCVKDCLLFGVALSLIGVVILVIASFIVNLDIKYLIIFSILELTALTLSCVENAYREYISLKYVSMKLFTANVVLETIKTVIVLSLTLVFKTHICTLVFTCTRLLLHYLTYKVKCKDT